MINFKNASSYQSRTKIEEEMIENSQFSRMKSDKDEPLGGSEKFSLKIMLYLISAILMLEIPIIYQINHYHNVKYFLISQLTFLSFCFFVYLFGHINKKVVKFLFASCVATVLVDLIWLMVKAPSLWSIPQIANFSQRYSGYLKFCVFLTFVIMILKLGIAIILFFGRDYHEISVLHVKTINNKSIAIGAAYKNTNPIVQTLPNQPIP